MIPKIIHYCWFGKGEMPPLANECIASWKKFLPDYELMLWSEENFDVNSQPYTKEAYESRKFAFVTDYVRMYALYEHGGIYMDTDVEVLKSFDEFLALSAFSGFETEKDIPTGIIASAIGNPWVQTQLDYYKDRHFIKADGSLDTTTNVIIISEIMRKGGFQFNNTKQNYQGNITMFPKDYFCPKSYLTGKIELTENTFCIHHFAGSWHSPTLKLKKKIIQFIGPKIMNLYVKITGRSL
jgi:mannosyltransferase OCH1-like enzyme